MQPGGARESQGEPGKARESKGEPGRARESQGERGRARESHGEPGRARESQGEPGRAIESHREPGRARESLGGQGEPGRAKPKPKELHYNQPKPGSAAMFPTWHGGMWYHVVVGPVGWPSKAFLQQEAPGRFWNLGSPRPRAH